MINYLNLPPLQAKMIIDANFLECTDEIINILASISLNIFDFKQLDDQEQREEA